MANLIDTVLIQNSHWFERMWVVQAGIAGSVHLQIGDYALRWESFMRAVHLLYYIRNHRLDNITKVTDLEKIHMGWNDGKRQPL